MNNKVLTGREAANTFEPEVKVTRGKKGKPADAQISTAKSPIKGAFLINSCISVVAPHVKARTSAAARMWHSFQPATQCRKEQSTQKIILSGCFLTPGAGGTLGKPLPPAHILCWRVNGGVMRRWSCGIEFPPKIHSIAVNREPILWHQYQKHLVVIY